MTITFNRRVRFLLCVFVLAFVRSSQASEPASVMTYNIRYLNQSDGLDVWSNRSDAVIETIRGSDIVGLQEVVSAQFQTIQLATPGFHWYGVGRDDGKEAGEFAPIGFRKDRFDAIDQGTLWLSATPNSPGSRGWDAALPRTLTWVSLRIKEGGAQVLVLNTHFDHMGEQARRESGKLIADRVDAMAKEVPVIVMGDFNAKPDSLPIANVKSGKVVSLLDSRDVSLQPSEGSTGTWNGFQAVDPLTRIDHIFVDKRVKVLSHAVPDPKTKAGRFASDHLPVKAIVEF